jgi:hypothetical protein
MTNLHPNHPRLPSAPSTHPRIRRSFAFGRKMPFREEVIFMCNYYRRFHHLARRSFKLRKSVPGKHLISSQKVSVLLKLLSQGLFESGITSLFFSVEFRGFRMLVGVCSGSCSARNMARSCWQTFLGLDFGNVRSTAGWSNKERVFS